MIVRYKPSFLKIYKKLDPNLKIEIKEKIDLFKENPEHPSLRIHKLKGRLKGAWSFSVNYKIRILFAYEGNNIVVLLQVGDHSIYE